jgi:conjugal transfer pilus assembly protein TraW
MKIIRICSLLILLPLSAFAKDYGQVGPVYPIIETSLLDFIYYKLQEMNNSGDYKKIQQMMQANFEKKVIRPAGKILPQVTIYSERLFDPSVTIKSDLKNADGQVVVKSGTMVNPLKHISLTKEFIFINADNEKEVAYAANKLRENSLNKIILTSGNIKDTNLKLNAAVYFDQGAQLINKFSIKATPSVVGQSGSYIIIKEIAL